VIAETEILVKPSIVSVLLPPPPPPLPLLLLLLPPPIIIMKIIRKCLPTTFKVVSCLAYSSILKMEVTCPSETSVDFYRNTRSYIPEENFIRKISLVAATFFDASSIKLY
jgi:hypothetical protein